MVQMAQLEGVRSVMNRVAELQSRIDALSGQRATRASSAQFAATLDGVSQSTADAGMGGSSGTTLRTGRLTTTSSGSVPGFGAGGMAPSGVAVDEFARDVLAGIGAPLSAENLRVMRAWVRAEGTSARFNPLATTQRAPGATAFNSVGVRNFTSYGQGVATTVQVLQNGKYEPVLAALRNGTDAQAVAGAIARSPWGTGGLVSRILSQEATPRW